MPKKLALRGALDTASLLGISAGAFASSPLAAHSPLFLAGSMLTSGAGAVALAWPRTKAWLDRADDNPREGFVLKSDPPLPNVTAENGVLIGYTKDGDRPVYVPYDLLMRHIALIGASGVGKTTLGLNILWQQISRGGGALFIDAKIDVDTRDMLGYMCRVLGRESDFYVLNVDDPDHSNTYNPILRGDADEVSSRLLNLMPSSENNAGADYYRNSAQHALTAIVAGLKAAKRLYTFEDLSILLQSAAALEELLTIIPAGVEKRALEVFLDKYRRVDPKTGVAAIDVNKMKDVLGGMAGRLALFAQGQFGKVFNTYSPDIILEDIILGNKILYVMLPTMGKGDAALNLGKMLMSDLRTAVKVAQGVPKVKRPWPPYCIFADEMGSYVMEGIRVLFEQARSAQIFMMPGFQAMGNLEKISPDFKDSVLQSTWNKVFFRFGARASGEEAAELLGKSIQHQYSLSQSENSGESSSATQATPQGSASEASSVAEGWREAEGYRVSPDKLSGLRVGECVLMIGAQVYHLSVPRLTTPIDKEKRGEQRKPEYSITPYRRNPKPIPEGWITLNLADRYEDFLQGA
jgi:hypothetical protein